MKMQALIDALAAYGIVATEANIRAKVGNPDVVETDKDVQDIAEMWGAGAPQKPKTAQITKAGTSKAVKRSRKQVPAIPVEPIQAINIPLELPSTDGRHLEHMELIHAGAIERIERAQQLQQAQTVLNELELTLFLRLQGLDESGTYDAKMQRYAEYQAQKELDIQERELAIQAIQGDLSQMLAAVGMVSPWQ